MPTDDERPVLDLTVFILSFNRPHYLREMVQSVLSQTNLPEEIIILDNGSEKETRLAIEDLIGGRVRWIGADYNHQSLWNFQRAYGMSTKKYFCILHDDDRILPQFLERVVGALESDESLIAITTNGYRIDRDGRRGKEFILPRNSSGITYLNSSKDVAAKYSHSFVPFPNVVYRNGFPQKIPLKVEYGKLLDCIFLIDLASLGGIAILDELLFEYRIHQNQDSAFFPEDLLQKKEDYIMAMVQGDETFDRILRNVRRIQSERLARHMVNSFIKRRGDPRSFFKELKNLDYKYVTLKYIFYYIAFNQYQYLYLKLRSKSGW